MPLGMGSIMSRRKKHEMRNKIDDVILTVLEEKLDFPLSNDFILTRMHGVSNLIAAIQTPKTSGMCFTSLEIISNHWFKGFKQKLSVMQRKP